MTREAHAIDVDLERILPNSGPCHLHVAVCFSEGKRAERLRCNTDAETSGRGRVSRPQEFPLCWKGIVSRFQIPESVCLSKTLRVSIGV